MQALTGVLVLQELLLVDYQICTLVVLNENLDVGLRGDHLGGIVQRHTLVTDGLANLAKDVGKLLQIVLHEVDLRVIVLLHSIKAGLILAPYLINVLID